MRYARAGNCARGTHVLTHRDGRAFAQFGESIRFRGQRKPTRLGHNALRHNYLGLTNRGKRFLRALAKLFRSRAKFSFPRNDSHRDALWFGR
jgi:hypothetical protein